MLPILGFLPLLGASVSFSIGYNSVDLGTSTYTITFAELASDLYGSPSKQLASTDTMHAVDPWATSPAGTGASKLGEFAFSVRFAFWSAGSGSVSGVLAMSPSLVPTFSGTMVVPRSLVAHSGC